VGFILSVLRSAGEEMGQLGDLSCWFSFPFSFPPPFSWRSRAVIVRGGRPIGGGSGGGGGGKDMWLIKLFFLVNFWSRLKWGLGTSRKP
jgi:hypothetical protein